MATKKTKKRPAKTTQPSEAPVESPDTLAMPHKHRLHLHNITTQTAYWLLAGGSNRLKGSTPPLAESSVRVTHAKSYRITFWGKDPKKKESAVILPDGSAVYTGRKVVVTQPH